jgi:hypothetical protein
MQGMTKRSLLTRALATVGVIGVIVGLIHLSSGWFWLYEGSPTIPELEGRWWGGYYKTSGPARQWCVARFVKTPSGQLQMALIFPSGAPDVFDVERSSSNKAFVYLTFVDRQNPPGRIEAKQLYAGERYYLGRLMVGRFSDFWKMNEDITIRGNIVSSSPEQEFAIEPIAGDRLEHFWTRFVRPDQPTPSPTDILTKSGISLP